MVKKKISIKQPECDHDYNCDLQLEKYKMIDKTCVIRGLGVLTSVCEKCGHTKNEIVSGGYFEIQEE